MSVDAVANSITLLVHAPCISSTVLASTRQSAKPSNSKSFSNSSTPLRARAQSSKSSMQKPSSDRGRRTAASMANLEIGGAVIVMRLKIAFDSWSALMRSLLSSHSASKFKVRSSRVAGPIVNVSFWPRYSPLTFSWYQFLQRSCSNSWSFSLCGRQ